MVHRVAVRYLLVQYAGTCVLILCNKVVTKDMSRSHPES